MLTSKQRAALRKAANGLDPVFQVGKGEIDETLIKSTADCLAARELIKMKVLETSLYSAREPSCWPNRPAPRWCRSSAPSSCSSSKRRRRAALKTC